MGNPVFISVHVTPKSGRDEIVGFENGMQGEVLKVRISVAPAEGKANKAVCKFLADKLGVSKSSVNIAGGATSRYKRIAINADEQLVSKWLAQFRGK